MPLGRSPVPTLQPPLRVLAPVLFVPVAVVVTVDVLPLSVGVRAGGTVGVVPLLLPASGLEPGGRAWLPVPASAWTPTVAGPLPAVSDSLPVFPERLLGWQTLLTVTVLVAVAVAVGVAVPGRGEPMAASVAVGVIATVPASVAMGAGAPPCTVAAQDDDCGQSASVSQGMGLG